MIKRSVSRLSVVRRNFSMISPVEEMPLSFQVQKQQLTPSPTKNSVLQNGIKITTKGQINPVVDLKYTIAAGSIFETEETKGCAHYLKNIVFAGTSNKSSIRLIRDLENIGAVFSSSADRENVVIHIRVLSNFVEKAFEIIADSIVSPPKALYLVSEAKDAVDLDYSKYHSSPAQQLDELMHEVAFSEASPYGSSFFAESADNVNAANVMKYRSERFLTSNLSLSVNGIPHETALALAECYFHGLPSNQHPSAFPKLEYVGGSLRVKANLEGATYAGLAFPVDDKVNYLALYEALTHQLNKKDVPKGSLTPFYTPYSNGGLIGFFAGGTAASVSETIKSGISELKLIANGQVDLKPALKQASLNNAIASESTDSSKPVSNLNFEEKNVRNAAERALKSKPSFVSFGKTLGTPSYETVLNWMK